MIQTTRSEVPAVHWHSCPVTCARNYWALRTYLPDFCPCSAAARTDRLRLLFPVCSPPSHYPPFP